MMNKQNQESTDTRRHYHGHRKRLRGRFISSPESLEDYELLELLLCFSVPRRDVKPLAKSLLEKFSSLNGVLNASYSELKKAGLTDSSSVLITLLREIEVRRLAGDLMQKPRLNNPEDVAEFASRKLVHQKNEQFMVIYLNTKNRVIDYEILNEGIVNQAVVYPRNVIKNALERNATGIIVVHNHPSGEYEPSANDIQLTSMIAKAADTVEIKLLDHLIVAESGTFSFRINKLL
jgi:DNA repair protein RadC